MNFRLWAGVTLTIASVLGVSASAAGPLELPSKQPEATRIAVLGCIRQFERAPALLRYLELDADLAIWVGDNIYADTQDDPAFIQRCYDALEQLPGFQELRASVPFEVTWDDHDYGDNNEDKHYPLKEEAKNIFLKFWGLTNRIPSDQPGVYSSAIHEFGGHRLQVILLDVRYNRDAPGTDADILGAEQWQWFERQFDEEADLRLIVSGTQVLLDAETGSETWQNYPRSGERLFQLLRENQAERTLLLTGDQHYAEVARLRGALDFDAVELQFAGINQIESPEFNTMRVANASSSKHSVCYLDIQWEGTKHDAPHLTFHVADAESGQIELRYRVNFDELELPLNAEGQRRFTDTTSVSFANPFPDLEVRYAVDGSQPGQESMLYTGAVELNDCAFLSAAYFLKNGARRGKVHEFIFERVEPFEAISGGDLTAGALTASYFEGQFSTLPDFESLKPLQTMATNHLKVDQLALREDHYALLFEGFLMAPETGVYHFATYSDDGSRLMIHGQEVVNNDGSHSARTRTGEIALSSGIHPLRLEYFEDYMGQTLELRWQLPGSEEWKVVPFENLMMRAE